MNVEEIIQSLKEERNRIDAAIAALGGSGSSSHARTSTNGTRKRRTMSAEAKARISAAQKKRWAKIKTAKKK
jgi:hypothetical protein